MSGPADRAAEVARWLDEADEELLAARVLAADTGLARRIACFHAHLGAEKALKAVMLLSGNEFRRVHNLLELRNELPDQLQERFDPTQLARLNRWATAGRYTTDRAPISDLDAEALIDAAAVVVASARAASTEGDGG